VAAFTGRYENAQLQEAVTRQAHSPRLNQSNSRRSPMKHKQLFTLSLLSLASAACMAQSSVTMYGILDAGVSTTSGMAGGTKKAMISGIMDGSRFGVRGNEDIGGGFRALFVLENRLEVDTGSNSNVPPSGAQLPDRYTQRGLIFNALPQFALPAVVPAATAAAAVAGATAGFNGGLQSVVNGVGAQVGPTLGVNVGNARFWDRQAYVGLITPVGAVLAGRQYTPAYEVNAEFDTLQTQSSLAAGQVAAVPGVIDIRQSNAVQFRIVKDGITLGLMAAAGEGSTAQGRFYGGQLVYRGDAFSVGVGYNTKKNELGQKSLTTETIGASVNVGPGKLSFLYNGVKDENPSGLSPALAGFAAGVNQVRAGIAANPAFSTSLGPAGTIGSIFASQINVASLTSQYADLFRQNSAVWSVGYKYVTGPHTIYVAFNEYDDKSRFNADTDSYGAVYSYALSKRTDVNFVLTQFNNKGLGQAAPGQAGFLGGFTRAAGVDSRNIAMGLRHRF
jgi:predicted porin